MQQNSFIPFALPDLTRREIDAVVDTMESGWLTTGPNASAFEKEFCDFLGGNLECVSVNSATAGLHLAVEALGIGPGDEVLVPTWTFTSSAEVVRYVGATPILVDVHADTLTIDFEDAERRITEKTKAIIPVHFAGDTVPRRELRDFAERHNLSVVEDAAHSFPVKSEGQWIGTGESEFVVFSFYATKTMTTGEGGMLVTTDPKLAQRARTMRLHGISRDVFDRYTSTKPSWHYDVIAPGFKYNLTDIAAAIGRVQLERAIEMRENRASIAKRYCEAFAELPIQLPLQPASDDEHSWHLFVIRVDSESGGISRDDFITQMAEAGVGCSVHFIPLHLQPYYRDTWNLQSDDYPVATQEFNRTVSLPIWSGMSDDQVNHVISAVKAQFE